MYEYRLRTPKTGELILALWLVCLSVLLFFGSFLSWVTDPLPLHLLAALPLFLAAQVASSCLLRDYSCRIDGEKRELTVLEHTRSRTRTVCRLVPGEITEIMPDTKETRRALKEKYPSLPFYNYTARFFAKERHLLLFDVGEGPVCVVILADQTLFAHLSTWL